MSYIETRSKEQELSLEMMRSVWEANSLPLPERLTLLDRTQRTLDLMKIHVRLVYDLGIHTQDGYKYRQERLQEIGKMLGAWRNNTRRKLGLSP